MSTLIFRSGATAADVGRNTVHGAYLLQSERDPTQFRIGISGQRDRGTFWSRLNRTHRARAVPDNWTTTRRPWKALWTLEIVDGTALAACMVEHLIYAILARRHCFTSDSGFTAPAEPAEMILAELVTQTDTIISMMEAQVGKPVEARIIGT
jgi:hypothetical protein